MDIFYRTVSDLIAIDIMKLQEELGGDLIYMCAALIQSITCKSGLVSYFAFHLYEAAAEERMGE